MNTSTKLLDFLKNRSGTLAFFFIDDDFLRFAVGKHSPDPINDRISLCESMSNPCLIDIGSPYDFVPKLATHTTILEETPEYITQNIFLKTPLGDKGWVLKQFKLSGVEKISEAASTPVSSVGDFELFEWYHDVIRDNDWSVCKNEWSSKIKSLNGRAIPSIFLCPPFELLYWVKREYIFLHYFDFPQKYKQAMDFVIRAYKYIIDAARDSGVNIITYGAPGGTEFTSPSIWQEAIVPSSEQLQFLINQAGLYSLFHCCGKVNTIIKNGYLDQIQPTMFETLAPEPVGDIKNLSEARRNMAPSIITHGNLDLTFLRDATEREVIAATEKILSEVKGYAHIIGAADGCLLPNTPIHNIKAVCELLNLQ